MMQPSFLSHLCQESCGNWDLMTLLWFDLSAGPRPFFEQESRLWCIQLDLKPDVQHKITSNRLRPYSIGFCFIGLTTNSPISRSTWKGQTANAKNYWASSTACSAIRRWCLPEEIWWTGVVHKKSGFLPPTLPPNEACTFLCQMAPYIEIRYAYSGRAGRVTAQKFGLFVTAGGQTVASFADRLPAHTQQASAPPKNRGTMKWVVQIETTTNPLHYHKFWNVQWVSGRLVLAIFSSLWPPISRSKWNKLQGMQRKNTDPVNSATMQSRNDQAVPWTNTTWKN